MAAPAMTRKRDAQGFICFLVGDEWVRPMPLDTPELKCPELKCPKSGTAHLHLTTPRCSAVVHLIAQIDALLGK